MFRAIYNVQIIELKNFLFLVVLCFSISHCGGNAYIFNAQEFNRQSSAFGEGTEEVDSIIVCYNKASASIEAIRKLAFDGCAEGGKYPILLGQNYSSCPLFTPISAIFSCSLPLDNAQHNNN